MLSPEEVKQRVSALNQQLEDEKQKWRAAETAGRKIMIEIKSLQCQCPHEHKKNDLVEDAAEMKLCTICTDCGLQS